MIFLEIGILFDTFLGSLNFFLANKCTKQIFQVKNVLDKFVMKFNI